MGDHFYTTDQAERDTALARAGYHTEGDAAKVFSGPSAGTIPFFRLFNPDTGDHFYTTSASERDNAVRNAGYSYELISCYVFGGPVAGAVPLYRLWNGENDHFYTTSDTERDSAIRNAGYRSEGIACYVYDKSSASFGTVVPLYRLYKPGRGVFVDIGDFISDVANGIVGAVTTVGNAILDTIMSTLGAVLDVIGRVAGIILSIPGIGWLWNFFLTAFWGLFSFWDALAGLLGIFPEKRLRVMVIIQRDESNQPIVEPRRVLRFLQVAIDVFKQQANIRIIPVGPFIYSSAFQDIPEASTDYIYVEKYTSSSETLDVNCGVDGFVDDLGTVGIAFKRNMTLDLFWGSFRRLIGYGAPIAAFAVREFKPDDEGNKSVGCSLGPLTDYVLVDFGHGNPRTLPHELGHACNLWHDDDPDNLMTPGKSYGVGMSLSRFQKILIRSSRHVTYF